MRAEEVQITDPPAAVRRTLGRLETQLAEIPEKQLEANLLIGTWNLRAFGGLTKAWSTPPETSPKRNLADLVYIAAILSRFDVVAVQEVRGNLRALRYLLKLLGEDWGFIMTDVTKGSAGNDERLAFLFDTSRVKPSGLACELVVPIESDPAKIKPGAFNRQFARTPYAVSFVSADTTFILVTLHIDYGDAPPARVPELRAIADWLADWAERENGWDHNLIALGDFNIDRAGDPLFDAFTSTGLTPAPPLANARRMIFDEPTRPHYYDQIAWFTAGAGRPVLSLSCSGGGVFDFVPELRGAQTLVSLSWHISDHYPLWVGFSLRDG